MKRLDISDEIHAAGLGVMIDCPTCKSFREMDECHRIQIGILKEDARESHSRYAENLRDVCRELDRQRKRKEHWRLGCFAGWFTVALFVISELWK